MTRASQAGADAVVEIVGVDKVFDTGARALATIDLAVSGGEFVTLIGPSGCGKSTLLRLVANLIRPTDGRLAWWGGGFERVGAAGRRLAFVFQEPTLMPWARVAANVRLPLALEGVGDADSRVETALEMVGLAGTERAFPRQLSGGMRMRVSIARALITEPNLLLMDEPFGALDEFTRNGLDGDLARLAVERRLTTIFVTHSIYEAVFVSTRVVLMGAGPGRIVRDLPIDEPVPRDAAFRDSPRFLAYCRQLSAWLAEASVGALR